MGSFNLSTVAVAVAFLLLQFTVFSSAQKSQSNWLTLDGSPPLVIARNGFSGLFPPASSYAYNLAMMTSVPDLVLWCDIQLTKDGAGICFRDIMLDNSSSVSFVYPKRESTYNLNGDRKKGYFPVDFTLKELSLVSLTQGIYSRSPDFDGSAFEIQTVENVFMQNKPAGFWLNVQNDAFYSQHKLSMRSFVISASKKVIMSHISSSEVKFLQGLARPFAATKTKLIFQFLEKGATEPSTNQTYDSLLKNLPMIKKFAAGILVPKSYIWPVDALYLRRHTPLVADAHKIGLEVFASDFANDAILAYNYSYNPVNEYLSYIDNGDFSVDGLLSDFPLTPSEARECFAHVGKNAPVQAKTTLVISHHGASGDFPGCTDVAYEQAIKDGADVIDCNVQMSKDGIPFCLSTVNLMNSTLVGQTQFRSEIATIKDFGSNPGIYSFSLNWTDIQGLTPVISNPYSEYFLYRNPKSKNVGKIISLADFLNIAKNATSLHGVLISIENANYLALNEGYSITKAVSDALEKGGYNGPTAKKVMIQSTNSSVLKAMKGKKYELVYEVDESISGAKNDTIASIKTFADSVVVNKQSIFPSRGGFLTGETNVVQQLKSVKLAVYVQVLRNEFVSQAYDFFSDPIVEINSYVMEGGVDGIITDFPKTAADYKKNPCLNMKNTPAYMSPVQPGQLMQLITPLFMPPAEAPNPFLSVADVSESPLPAPVKNAPATATAETPKTSRNSQNQISASALLSFLSMIVAAALLF